MPSREIQSRLKKDRVAWLVTVGPDGRPHVVVVWYWWDGESILIYSLPGRKVDDIKANPNVELHLNTDEAGDEVVRITGTARIDRNAPPAYKVPAYVRRYRDQMKGFGMTPQTFSEQYRNPIRIRPTKFH